MEVENKTEEQVMKAIESAYDEKIISNPHSKDIGRVRDSQYAKYLAYYEDSVREMNPQSENVKRYSENIIGEEIIKNMEEVAARKISFNKGNSYPDAHIDLVKKGITPVERYHSRKKYLEIDKMQEAEKIRREYLEQEAKSKIEGN
jgi:hypothetical protein